MSECQALTSDDGSMAAEGTIAAAELAAPPPAFDRSALIVDHRDCGRKLATRLLREWRIQLNREEIDGIADLALCEAADRFDITRGVRFSTFLFYYIRGNLLRMIEKTVAEKRIVQAVQYSISASRNEHFDINDTPDINPVVDPDACLAGESGTPEEFFLRQETIAAVTQACHVLSTQEREVIQRRFMRGESPAEIAQALGCSRREVQFFERSAFNTLKPLLAAAGFGPADEVKKAENRNDARSAADLRATGSSATRRARRLRIMKLIKGEIPVVDPAKRRAATLERRVRRFG